MPPADAVDFLVSREDLRETRVAAATLPDLQDGEALLRVDRFALTANNVTYGVFGEAMAYWGFFPAAAGWGRIPVWGFADVLQSRHAQLREGERVFGYLPMSTHLRVQPDRVKPGSFVDAAPHRTALPAAYQLYRRSAGDPLYDPAWEDLQSLLTPLYMTSFLIEDFLGDNAWFGAGAVLLSSASSKTALGVAWQLRQDAAFGGEVIGLTSSANRAFCEATGCYDRVLAYEELSALPVQPAIYVDMAGNGRLLHDVHHHLRDSLKYSCMVGGTHWQQRQTQHNLPGAKPQFFFAPTQIKKRHQDWGPGQVDARFALAWQGFRTAAARWMRVEHHAGTAALERLYRDMVDGRVDPAIGHIASLHGG